MDILGPLPTSRAGNRYALVISDYFTKWPEVIAIVDQEAETVARVFVKEFVCRYGVPLELHSDQGRNFESILVAETLRVLGTKKTRTTALHPQSDGMVERLNRTLLRYLSAFVEQNQRDWDEWIPLFLLSYRSAVHETTGLPPATMLMGWNLRLPSDLEKGIPPSQTESPVDFVISLREKLDEIHEFGRNRIEVSSNRMKARYDIRARSERFKVGDRVWLFQPRRQKGRCPKLQSNWEGPYEVLTKINDVIFRIQQIANSTVQRKARAKAKVVHMDRLAPYDGRVSSPDSDGNSKQLEIRRLLQDQSLSEFDPLNQNLKTGDTIDSFVASSSWSPVLPFGIQKRDSRPLTIIVEGNIGCGKTTFTRKFLRDENILTLLEPLEEYRNVVGINLLSKMYADPSRYAYQFQHHALMTMRKRHLVETHLRTKIMERSIYSGSCFVEARKRLGGFEPLEAHLLTENSKIFVQSSSDFKVDLVIYLRLTPKVSFTRLQSRAREEEACITLEYLTTLHEVHEDWLVKRSFSFLPAPVLILNAELSPDEIYENFSKTMTGES